MIIISAHFTRVYLLQSQPFARLLTSTQSGLWQRPLLFTEGNTRYIGSHHSEGNTRFSDHITQLSRSCFMHIRDLRRIRPMLDLKTASTIATSIVHAKLDYCNSLFLNIDVTQIN